MLCLAFPLHQKSGMILVVLKLQLPKNHLNKKCAPKLLFFIEKKIKKIHKENHFESPILALFDEVAKLGKASGLYTDASLSLPQACF